MREGVVTAPKYDGKRREVSFRHERSGTFYLYFYSFSYLGGLSGGSVKYSAGLEPKRRLADDGKRREVPFRHERSGTFYIRDRKL